MKTFARVLCGLAALSAAGPALAQQGGDVGSRTLVTDTLEIFRDSRQARDGRGVGRILPLQQYRNDRQRQTRQSFPQSRPANENDARSDVVRTQ